MVRKGDDDVLVLGMPVDLANSAIWQQCMPCLTMQKFHCYKSCMIYYSKRSTHHVTNNVQSSVRFSKVCLFQYHVGHEFSYG